MPYEWKTDKAGNRRYVRIQGDTRIERISEDKGLAPVKVTAKAAEAGEMAVEAPDGNFVAKVESSDAAIVPVANVESAGAAVSVPTTKAPVKRRGTRSKKS